MWPASRIGRPLEHPPAGWLERTGPAVRHHPVPPGVRPFVHCGRAARHRTLVARRSHHRWGGLSDGRHRSVSAITLVTRARGSTEGQQVPNEPRVNVVEWTTKVDRCVETSYRRSWLPLMRLRIARVGGDRTRADVVRAVAGGRDSREDPRVLSRPYVRRCSPTTPRRTKGGSP